MGERLAIDLEDDFFEPQKVSVNGIAGSCYCCNQQLHVHFDDLENLPLSKVNRENHYVLICDDCEDDVRLLNESGISDISYDYLWMLQDPLEEGLYALEEQNGEVTSIDREVLLVTLYRKLEKKIK